MRHIYVPVERAKMTSSEDLWVDRADRSASTLYERESDADSSVLWSLA